MFRFFRNLIRTTKDTLTFITSLGRSGFAQELGKNTGQWFSHAADSVIVGASVFVTHLGLSLILPPAATIGAIGVGLLVRHRLNKVRGLDKIRSPARKTALTFTTVAGAIAGGIIAGPFTPLGLAAGAAMGNFSGNLILNTVSNLTSPSGGALNLFTRATENLPFLPSALTPPRPRTLGCLLLTVILIPTLVLIFTATVILSIFLRPRSSETTTLPPTLPADCLSGWPVDTSQGQQYEVRQGPGGSISHGPPKYAYQEAIDIYPLTHGSLLAVKATHPGKLEWYNNEKGGMGISIISDPLKCKLQFRSTYAHLFARLKPNGAHVEAGENIAIMGNTGSMGGSTHLHYEFRNIDVSIKDRSDPPPYMIEDYIPKTVPEKCLGGLELGGCNIAIP